MGKFGVTEGILLDNNQVVTRIFKHEPYKYLNLVQANNIENTLIIENLKKQFENFLNIIMETTLNYKTYQEPSTPMLTMN